MTFDEMRVTLRASPPRSRPWEQTFAWSEVTRICFKSEGKTASDGIYVFTAQRPESFVIPIEAKGGADFWGQVVKRGLFPEDRAISAASSSDGTMTCWPPVSY